MSRWSRPLAALVAVAGAALAAPIPAGPTEEVVADAKAFVPNRKYLAHAGTVIGVIASDVAAAQGREGRGGPPDAMGFSVDGSSYNWMYTVSEEANPLISGLRVKVGPNGDDTVVYPKLDMARPKTVAAWDIKAAYVLAEVEVNNGKGCPADEAFVATKIKPLDGTKAFPLKVEELVKAATVRFAADADKAVDAETWEKARKDALGDRKATGPKESRDVMYVTWLSESKRLRVAFLRAATDGDYKQGGGANVDPPALPALDPPPPGAKPGRQPPPPRLEGVRWGTQFGVEYGRAYEFSTAGELVAIKTLKPKATKAELPPPPMNPRGGPFPLPPPPLPKKGG
jgi:hypothetical protein